METFLFAARNRPMTLWSICEARPNIIQPRGRDSDDLHYAFHHVCELRLVFSRDILELQAKADSRQDKTYGRFGDDSAIFDKEVQLDCGVDWQRFLRFNEHAADTHISNTRSVFISPASPINPDGLGIFNPLMLTTRVNGLLLHNRPS